MFQHFFNFPTLTLSMCVFVFVAARKKCKYRNLPQLRIGVGGWVGGWVGGGVWWVVVGRGGGVLPSRSLFFSVGVSSFFVFSFSACFSPFVFFFSVFSVFLFVFFYFFFACSFCFICLLFVVVLFFSFSFFVGETALATTTSPPQCTSTSPLTHVQARKDVM